jgi:monoamine oxidase
VVTVPTEIIRRGLITFSPALPAPIVQAFALLPMGHYKKIFLPLNEGSGVSLALAALVTPAARLAEGQTDASLFTITADGVPWKFLYRVSLNVVVAFLGGRHASALDARSDAQVAAEALAVLAAALGMAPEAVNASWTQHVLTSKWSTDPWSHGAYSYTRPEGGIAARTTLRTTLVHQRIVFAGEAVRSSKEEYATAHGAWLSGEDAARSILDALE